MAEFGTEKNVGVDDRVRLVLGVATALNFEHYSVRTSILQQPSQFSVQLSAGGGTAEIINRFPAGTPFELNIGEFPQFSGRTDGFDTAGTSGSTSITFHGRDSLAQLFDNDIDAERSFQNITIEGAVRAALKEVGLDDRLLQFENADNRNGRAGARVKVISEPKTVKGVVYKATTVHAKIGETWFAFVQRHLAKEGLFIWSDGTGGFVVTRPNKHQQPMYRFVRQRGQLRNVVNIEDAHYKNDTTRRFSECTVYGRAGGKKFGHLKIKGSFADDEMGKTLGLKKLRVFRDVHAANAEESTLYARRKIAEMNRASWQLTYTFSGHTAPIDGQGGRAVVVPDTIASVTDEENGINGEFYIESVEYTSPPRQTRVTLMRIQDLIFGTDD